MDKNITINLKTIAMKNQNKHIALEDTHSGDVMGGCYGNRGEFFRRFFFERGRMSRLSKTEWNEGDGLEELLTWGVEPIKALVDAIQNEFNGDTKMGERFIVTITCLVEDKINEIDETISRFNEELVAKRRVELLEKQKKGGIS